MGIFIEAASLKRKNNKSTSIIKTERQHPNKTLKHQPSKHPHNQTKAVFNLIKPSSNPHQTIFIAPCKPLYNPIKPLF
jgi:hypothetical protein